LCELKEPPEFDMEDDHLVACWLYEKK